MSSYHLFEIFVVAIVLFLVLGIFPSIQSKRGKNGHPPAFDRLGLSKGEPTQKRARQESAVTEEPASAAPARKKSAS